MIASKLPSPRVAQECRFGGEGPLQRPYPASPQGRPAVVCIGGEPASCKGVHCFWPYLCGTIAADLLPREILPATAFWWAARRNRLLTCPVAPVALGVDLLVLMAGTCDHEVQWAPLVGVGALACLRAGAACLPKEGHIVS